MLILAIFYIIIVLYFTFVILKRMYNMGVNIKNKEMDAVKFDILILVIVLPLYYYLCFVSLDVRDAFIEIINYFN